MREHTFFEEKNLTQAEMSSIRFYFFVLQRLVFQL